MNSKLAGIRYRLGMPKVMIVGPNTPAETLEYVMDVSLLIRAVEQLAQFVPWDEVYTQRGTVRKDCPIDNDVPELISEEGEVKI